ncbi:hypothetical protein OG216_00040 [Streptomycetaceae bacterium NBC_01309]
MNDNGGTDAGGGADGGSAGDAGGGSGTAAHLDALVERLRGTLTGARKESRLVKAYDAAAVAGLTAGPMRGNLLMGVSLHAAARLSQNLAPTDLEAEQLEMLRATAQSEAEVVAIGKAFHNDRLAGVAMPLVPQVILSRTTAQGYTRADLQADAPGMIEEVTAKPNVVLLDREGYSVARAFDSKEFVAAMDGPRFGVAAFARPHGDPGSSAAGTRDAAGEGRAAPPSFRARLEAVDFYVEEAVGDQGGGKDEIYWCSAPTTDEATAEIWHSEEFGSVKTGQTREFGSNRVIVEGPMTYRVAFDIQCWEADQSSSAWYDALHEQLKAFRDGIFSNPGFQLGAMMPGLELVGWMADINNLGVYLMEHLRNGDDLSCHRGFVFDRYDLSMIKEQGGVTWHFNGDGHHVLRVRYTGEDIPFPVGTLEYRVLDDGTWGSPVPLPWESITAPAVASYNGALYAVYARPDKAVVWTRLKNRVWSEPQPIHGLTAVVAPALSTIYNVGTVGALHLLVTGVDGALRLLSFDGTAWSGPRTLGGTSKRSPALGSIGRKLVAAHVGMDDFVYWCADPATTSWRLQAPQWTVQEGVTLANDHHGGLWMTVCGMDHRVWTCGLRDPNATAWSTDTEQFPTIKQADVTHSPALTHDGNWGQMRAYMRGSDERLWSTYLIIDNSDSGWTYWNQPTVLGGEPGTTVLDQPATAHHLGRTYVMYRR